MTQRRHLVLTTYGEPPTPAFLDHLAYSWRILLSLTRQIDAIPLPVLPLIAWSRARGRKRAWREHAYGSPLEAITQQQARALAARLGKVEDAEWHVHVVYEHRRPLVAEVLRQIPNDEPVWALPLYAAESAFTHALTRDAATTRTGPTVVLDAMAPQVLGKASADHVRAQTEDSAWHGPDVALVLAAHGTVLNPPKPIDTGLQATQALCDDIGARLSDRFGLVVNGWLNHTRGGKWTEPSIEDTLASVEKKGIGRVVYFPYGFLGDNAESQLEGELAVRQTSLESRFVPCLNDSPLLLDVLQRQVLASAAAQFTQEGRRSA